MKKGFVEMNSMRRITKREFWLLAVLLFALEGYLLYNYLIMPMWQDFQAKSSSYVSKLDINEKLKRDYVNMDNYKEKKNELDTRLEELEAVVPPYVSQEEIINSIDKLAYEKMISIGSITFNDKKVFSATTANSNSSDSKQAQTSSPSQQATASGPVAVEQQISLELSGNYSSLNSFIEALESSKRKIYISKLDLSRDETSILRGSLELSFVSFIDSSDNKPFKMDTQEIKGRSDLFEPYDGFSNGADSTAPTAPTALKPNFYLQINTNMDSAAKVIMGEYPKAETETYSNTNGEVRCKLLLTSSENGFNYSYTIGTLTRSSTKALEITEGSIRLEVISQEIKSADDKVSVVLDVDNRTGKPLDITIVKDDVTKPRFKLGTKTGVVNIK